MIAIRRPEEIERIAESARIVVPGDLRQERDVDTERYRAAQGQQVAEREAIVVRARLVGFDRSLEEAAQDLGANELQTFWRVTLPLLMPAILGGALLAFTLSLDDFVITFFTAGVGSTTLPLRIYSMVKLGITPEINAISTLMLLASMTLLMLSLLLQRKGGGSVAELG